MRNLIYFVMLLILVGCSDKEIPPTSSTGEPDEDTGTESQWTYDVDPTFNDNLSEKITPLSGEIESLKDEDFLYLTAYLVHQEKHKEFGDLEAWITSNKIYSNKRIVNYGNYNIMQGEMDRVFVTGQMEYILGTNSDTGEDILQTLNFDLEYYKMVGSSTWCLGERWGVLRDLKAPNDLNLYDDCSESTIKMNDAVAADEGKTEGFQSEKFEELIGTWKWNSTFGSEYSLKINVDGTYTYREGADFESSGTYTHENNNSDFWLHFTPDDDRRGFSLRVETKSEKLMTIYDEQESYLAEKQ